MNCFLLSGGLFQIYSNPIDYFISYEDISRKAIDFYSISYPNFVSTFNKYYNKIVLTKNELSNIEKINAEFIDELNMDSPNPLT